jgi:hypothetical protein
MVGMQSQTLSADWEGLRVHRRTSNEKITFISSACQSFIYSHDHCVSLLVCEISIDSTRLNAAVQAAISVSNIVRTSLGPVGLDKMMVDDVGVRHHFIPQHHLLANAVVCLY